MTPAQELAALWVTAEARRDTGQPPSVVRAPAYSLPPGDREISARTWMTEAESDRAHALGLEINRSAKIDAAGARARLLAKHAARRAKNQKGEK